MQVFFFCFNWSTRALITRVKTLTNRFPSKIETSGLCVCFKVLFIYLLIYLFIYILIKVHHQLRGKYN